MIEVIVGIVAGILTVLLAEIRRRRGKIKVSSSPPPPSSSDICKRCYFFREFRRLHRVAYPPRDSDTKIIRLLRENGHTAHNQKENEDEV